MKNLVRAFRLVRFSTRRFDDVVSLATQETRNIFSVTYAKMQVAQIAGIIKTIEQLNGDEKWYTIFQDMHLIIQADEPFDGRLQKTAKEVVEVILLASIRHVGLLDEYYSSQDEDKTKEDNEEKEEDPMPATTPEEDKK